MLPWLARRLSTMVGWWSNLTIVVPTSPVPSNPSTDTIRAVFASFALVKGLPRARKLVQFDGPQRQLAPRRVQDYDAFEARVRELASQHADFAHTAIYRSRTFLFAAHNLAAAVRNVNTTFMLVLQVRDGSGPTQPQSTKDRLPSRSTTLCSPERSTRPACCRQCAGTPPSSRCASTCGQTSPKASTASSQITLAIRACR